MKIKTSVEKRRKIEKWRKENPDLVKLHFDKYCIRRVLKLLNEKKGDKK